MNPVATKNLEKQRTVFAPVRSNGILPKLDAFLELLQKEHNERIKTQHSILHDEAIAVGAVGYQITGYDEGGRFWRVWLADSHDRISSDTPGGRYVKYFVERNTGVIFGAKSWDAYNPVREYGTLDTIEEWDWSNYYGESKTGKDTLVPKHLRR